MGLGFRVDFPKIWGYLSGAHIIMENQMEKKMENDIETVVIPKLGGTFIGAGMIRIVMFWGLE